MKHVNMIVVMAGLMLIPLPVLAEEIVITHRSGKVQIIQVDSSIDPIESLTLRRSGGNNVSTMPPPSAQPSPRTTATPPPEPPKVEGTVTTRTPDEAKVSGKRSVKYKWAPPLDQQ